MNFFSKLIVICLIILAIIYVKDNFITDKNDNVYDQIHQPKRTETQQTYEQNPNMSNGKNTETVKPTINIYFTNSNSGALKKITKSLPSNEDRLNYAVNELLKGPDLKEKNQGYSSEIPKGTKLLGIKDEGSIIILDISDEFQYGGGTESQYTRLNQLIKTVLEQKPNKPVYLYLNGKKAEIIGGEGILLTQPLSENSLNG